jgi:hypothetical protein
MKALKIILQILKWILILLIVLFALATFMAKSYANTLALLVSAAALAYWPGSLKGKPAFLRIGKRSTSLPLMKRLFPTPVLDKIFKRKFGLDQL